MNVTVRVLPKWRIHYRGTVYGPGETVTLPILTGVEFCAWGSAEPVKGLRKPR